MNMTKRHCRFLKGLICTWTTVDPLAPIESQGELISNTTLHHKNSITLMKIYNDLNLYKKYICNYVHNWEVNIDGIFVDNDGKQYVKGYVVKSSCNFHNLDEVVVETIEKIFENANMKHYKHTAMSAKIL